MMNNKTRCKKTVAIIYNGGTWRDVEEAIGIKEVSIKTILRKEYYKNSTAYKKLLNLAKENAREKREAEKKRRVILIDTGYMLEKGIKGVRDASKKAKVFIPRFCICELRKMAEYDQQAKKLLAYKWPEGKIKLIYSNERIARSKTKRRKRSVGIVANAIDLVKKGFKVTIYTNSKEVEDLALEQKCGIEVEKI